MVAEDYDRSIGVEFCVGTGGYVAHGHEDGVGQFCGLVLPWFADVQQERSVGLLALIGEGLRGDFGF